LVAALVLGACGLAIFFFTRAILAASAVTPRLSTVLAAAAALMPTLCPSGQREGTVAGGACLALLVLLLVLIARPLEAESDPRRALAVGLLLGALFAESGVVALAVGAGLALTALLLRIKVRAATWRWAAGAGIGTAALLFAPLYVRPFALRPFLDLGPTIAALGPPSSEVPFSPWGGVGLLRAELGSVAVLCAAAGAAVGLWRERLRVFVIPLAVIVLVDTLLSVREGQLVSVEELVPLHFVVLAVLSVAVALAVQAVASWLLDLELPLAKGATVLLTVLDLTVVAASAEDASFSADRRAWPGATIWTDEALERLPFNASVLVRSRSVAYRLWSARLAQGSRPDVIVVPTPILGDARVALGLLRMEPSAQQLVRDVSLEGRPGEESLTILADARPTLVELDPRWERRVISHLVPDHLWLRFAPQPLGPSDRKAAFLDLRSRFDRILTASLLDDHPDPITLSVLRGRLADATAEAASLGDREEAILLLGQLGKVSSGDRFVAELTQRLSATKSGSVDIKGLLR